MHSLSPFARLQRVHYASAYGTPELRRAAQVAASNVGAKHETVISLKLQAEAGDIARADIATVRRLCGRVAFLTAVRGRAVARMFGSVTIPVYRHLYASSGPVFCRNVSCWSGCRLGA